MKRSLTLLPSLVIALSFSLGAAIAQPGAVGGGGQVDPTAIYRDAGATPDQLEKIKTMAAEYEQSASVKAQRIQNLVKKMQDLSLEPRPSDKDVLATQDEINSLSAEMSNSRLKVMLKIRAMLTDEQRQSLVGLMKRRIQQAISAQNGMPGK